MAINLNVNLISKLVVQLVILVLIYLGMEFLLKSVVNLLILNKVLGILRR